MLFNSLDFAFFLIIVFAIYWLIPRRNILAQNAFILVASYIFYGWWDWRFLGLIFLSSFVDYLIGIEISKSARQKRRKWLLIISIFINLGILGAFKYFNFFVDSIIDAMTFFGSPLHLTHIDIVLPVGISFYTFQSMSYSIDVYRNKLKAEENIISFLAYVSFFPQLVAGPIERATALLPQFNTQRSFSYEKAVNGMRQMLWGLFKKIVIADVCSVFVNDIFSNHESLGGLPLVLGAVLFAFQIYCDFSGYSDIAIGCARLFGFELRKNFAFPYFSRDIAEFWRRWHISLSTWFRDYVYIPLGGSRNGVIKNIRNVFIIFIVSGFWHGANWTFIFWGALNAVYFLPLLMMNRNRNNLEIVASNKLFPHIIDIFKIIFTFSLVCIGWIFFRSENLSHALGYLSNLFTQIADKEMIVKGLNIIRWEIGIGFIIVLFLFISIEWYGRHQEYAIEKLYLRNSRFVRWGFYTVLLICTFYYSGHEADFIYFQF